MYSEEHYVFQSQILILIKEFNCRIGILNSSKSKLSLPYCVAREPELLDIQQKIYKLRQISILGFGWNL